MCICVHMQLFSGPQVNRQKERRRFQRPKGQQSVQEFTWMIVIKSQTGSQSLKKASDSPTVFYHKS